MKYRKGIFLIWDILFVVWCLTEQIFAHTTAAQIALAAFCVFSLLTIPVSDFKYFKFTYLVLIYALFISAGYLGMIYGNVFDEDSVGAMLVTLLINLVFLFCLYIYIRNRGAEAFKKLFVFTAAFVSVVFLAYAYFSTGIIVIREFEGTGLFNGNTLAVMDAIAISFVVYDIGKYGLKSIVFFLILSVFIILSGTKKAIIAVVIGIVLTTFLKQPKKLFKNALITAALLFGIYFVVMKIPAVYDIIGVRLEATFNYVFNGGAGDDSTISRANFIDLAMTNFSKRPVWGVGLDGFRTLREAYGAYSHNNYVELLCDTGLTGTIVYYLMHVVIFVLSLKEYFKGNKRYAILSLIVVLNVVALDYAMVTYYERTNVLYLVFCAALIAEGWKKKNE